MTSRTHSLQLSPLLVQPLHLHGQLGLGLGQLGLLGGHHLCHAVIHVHGTHPAAQTFTGCRGVLDQRGLKVRVGHVSVHKTNVFLSNNNNKNEKKTKKTPKQKGWLLMFCNMIQIKKGFIFEHFVCFGLSTPCCCFYFIFSVKQRATFLSVLVFPLCFCCCCCCLFSTQYFLFFIFLVLNKEQLSVCFGLSTQCFWFVCRFFFSVKPKQ